MTDYDLLCVGNAIIDLIAEVDFDFLKKWHVPAGSMTLIDAETMLKIQKDVQIKQVSGGGSAANTAVIAAEMGLKLAYLGKVAADKEGEDFSRDLAEKNIFFPSDRMSLRENIPTARCLIVVTPDKQRTMFTYLGACVEFSLQDISPSLVEKARMIYLEGYLFDKKEAKDAFRKIASLAHQAKNRVALTLSDVFCVARHRQEFHEFIKGHVDILFANQAELYALYEWKREEDFSSEALRDIPLIVMTCGEEGAVIFEYGKKISQTEAEKTSVIDTTGAGDAFAAGFLSAFLSGEKEDIAASYGHKAASHVISHFGGRPAQDFSLKVTCDN